MGKQTIFPGDIIGNWTIVEKLPPVRGIYYLRCRCNFCGTEKTLRNNNIAKTYSCGCSKRQYEIDPEARQAALGDTYPCDLCRSDAENCSSFRKCIRYRSWFSREWSGIRAAVEPLKHKRRTHGKER